MAGTGRGRTGGLPGKVQEPSTGLEPAGVGEEVPSRLQVRSGPAALLHGLCTCDMASRMMWQNLE